jgi:hypothetical protein
MPGLVPGIHVFLSAPSKAWMAGTDPVMTEERSMRPGVTSSWRHFFVLPGSFTASKVWNSTL